MREQCAVVRKGLAYRDSRRRGQEMNVSDSNGSCEPREVNLPVIEPQIRCLESVEERKRGARCGSIFSFQVR